MPNVLFICSLNKWRSPTAEKIYKSNPLLNVRSAGTSSKARRTLSVADLKWADFIIMMEEKHRERIQANFRKEVQFKELHVLDIEDNYQYMDPELINELNAAIDPILAIGSDYHGK